MWLVDQIARINAQLTLLTIYLIKPLFSFSADVTFAFELKEIICRDIIVNGHPFFRNRRK